MDEDLSYDINNQNNDIKPDNKNFFDNSNIILYLNKTN